VAVNTDLPRRLSKISLVDDQSFFPNLSTMVAINPQLLLLLLPAADPLMRHEVPAGEGPEPNMKMAAHPWAMDLHLHVLVDPLAPVETAPKLSEPRRKSLFDCVNEPGISSTHRHSQTIITIILSTSTGPLSVVSFSLIIKALFLFITSTLLSCGVCPNRLEKVG